MPGIISGSLIPNISIGGRLITDVANLKCLALRVSGSGSGNSTFRLANFTATSGYAVPANKVFKPKLMRFLGRVISDQAASLCYNDNDLGDGGNSVPTNPKYFAGSSNIYVGTLALPWEMAFYDDASVPAGKYISIIATSVTVVGAFHLFGTEESV